MKFSTFTKAVAGGVALSAILTGTAFADPAVIYDLGGKFDKSFNEAAYNGAEAWKAETGGSFLDLELQNDAQREQALRRFAGQGANPIVMAGFSWTAALTAVAPEFPDTNFVVIDTVVDAPNVQSIIFDEHTGSFLVGALAALKSETGTVGFVGGMDVPLIHKFYCGYAQGAKAVNADIKLIENYTGTTPAAWNDPVTAGELTKAAIDNGADVIFAAAGGSGLGVLQAAKDAGKYSIGVDSNQNYLQPGSVLTSMLKRVDVAVQNALTEAADDATFQPGLTVLGLAENGVGYSLDENNADLITADMQTTVDELSAQIQSGALVVHDYTTDSTCPL
ncbi:BMP family ABC transporter substrate-binding protein [Devosia sp. J2-20]|jgi:basic membrane protein A and related proteins|uniref:BMP family ABC transporter substrate-binding protein n=1 Tax=Devosia litorisediminis TaxID=2829817 RepID=A0A942I7A1_9HYPH|nr:MULTISPECIES: BMP family ABC transporter substrate-binding protein [Devosia]MBS3849908.1 BMP family ABC transporter substrate-binding protein [Devosia litorisediminis]MCZ4346908.1 BMP family ABC transporter substrate-binding protein [Devosia neptuniae]WDR00631.1 BMP family ABC transporter substrate-binding protein [Devosia sp. J2-20]|tara:strand:+ start:1894 stop:2898 length:1005 start_codon:yes stop_codon:yes gene_type:complete